LVIIKKLDMMKFAKGFDEFRIVCPAFHRSLKWRDVRKFRIARTVLLTVQVDNSERSHLPEEQLGT